ncbi:MAG: hypothetical protein B6I38_09890 [Anaerolineaceae bacterium 4572_5.1]|nr:MAG: hypothetical protein B6I38_09890 [Anaerolineaceae bacterium 4572_5.1]
MSQDFNHNSEIIAESPYDADAELKQQKTLEQEDCVHVGLRVRDMRIERGLTIRALAERCQLSANTLSLIENEKTYPNVNTLQLLARGLKVHISTFFICEKPKQSVVYQKRGERAIIRFSNGKLENLGDGLPRLGAEPILVTLDKSSEIPQDVSHVGREFIYCLDGNVACVIAGKAYELSTGDSLLFDASISHHWENARANSSKLLILFCTADAEDKPTEKHLGSF